MFPYSDERLNGSLIYRVLNTIFAYFVIVTLSPAYKMRDEILYARSNLLGSMLTYYAFFKQVWVDPVNDTISMEKRIFWFWKLSWQISFDDIRNIKYECCESKTDWDEYDMNYTALEKYIVGLNLNDGGYKKIFTFMGTDITSQGGESLSYVELLKFFTKKTIGPDHSRLREYYQDDQPVYVGDE